jgi:dTDP-glucose 4,6-dehydratase
MRQTRRKINIGGSNEQTNLEIITKILEYLDKPKGLIKFVTDRAAHDRRYALDCARISKELDWKPLNTFEESLAITVDWYLENKSWWERIKAGEYASYYERMYINR